MDDSLKHFPNGSEMYIEHPSHARVGINPFPDKLHVCTMVENPLRWRSRYWNYHLFQHEVKTAGAILYTVEVAFGDRPFEITQPDNPHHLQLRTHSEIWHKENALNLLINRVPLEAKYIACIDADLKFVRPDWAQETMQLLQHYDLIQMFSQLIDVDGEYKPAGKGPAHGIVYVRETNPNFRDVFRNEVLKTNWDDYSGIGSWGCPGGAWAYRRKTLDTLGGLIDWMITGAGDFWMAKALYGEIADVLLGTGEALQNFAWAWQENAMELKQNIGHMPGTVMHYWHGPKTKRGYDRRRPLLAQFNPLRDIRRSSQGLYELVVRPEFSGFHNTTIRDGLRHIARSRDEDAK